MRERSTDVTERHRASTNSLRCIARRSPRHDAVNRSRIAAGMPVATCIAEPGRIAPRRNGIAANARPPSPRRAYGGCLAAPSRRAPTAEPCRRGNSAYAASRASARPSSAFSSASTSRAVGS
nr:hypothetical protein WG70_13620 [Burkholderia oklahomensis EO147]